MGGVGVIMTRHPGILRLIDFKMASLIAEGFELGETLTRAAKVADALGTVDWIKDKFNQRFNRKRMPKRKRTYSRRTKRGRKRTVKRRQYKRKRSQLDKIGFRVGSGTAKRCVALNVASSEDTRTLYSTLLTQIPKVGPNVPEINARKRDAVNIRGFDFNFQFKNKHTKPVIVNMAWIHDRRDVDGGTGSMSFDDFFRGNFTQRGQNFPTNLGSPALKGIELNAFSLNPDRFVILKRKKFVLGPSFPAEQPSIETGYNFDSSKPYKFFNYYMPIKRQFRYEDGLCQSPIHVIWWYDEFQSVLGQQPQINKVDLQGYIVTHFKEPKLYN